MIHNITSRGVFVGLAVGVAALFGLLFVIIPRADAASDQFDEHLVTIHDHGKVRSVLTTQTTLRAVLREAKITLDPNDKVEPGLDEDLVARDYQVNIYRARPIVIVDGNIRQLIMSAYQTPKQIAEHAGMVLHDEDITKMELPKNLIGDGASLTMKIDRATEVNLVLYGKKRTVYTQTSTVADFIKEKNIVLGKNDTLSVKQSRSITSKMTIEIWRNGKQTVTHDEPIAFEIEQIEDKNRPIGYKKITEPGVRGKKTVTYEIVMKNGKEVARKKIQSVVIERPVKQVEIVGAKPNFSGDFGAALAKLRACESGGNYQINTGNGFYGAYQYDVGTWGNYGGYANASQAPPAVQDQKARETYVARGWSPWPSCGASLPDTYR